MKADKYLPIGSVVILDEGNKKLMIFGIIQSDQGDENGQEFDYIGVPYPEGNMGQDYQYLFYHRDIREVVARGYEDEEREVFIKRLDEYLKKNN